MCGIAGFVSTDRSAPGDPELARRMIRTLRHRGPDSEGIHVSPGCTLGHTRLAIIDPSPAGAQPMSNEDGSLWLVFNGEIHNYIELRSRLEASHSFRSQSDTEVILHLFEEKGLAALDELRGPFAIALWDQSEGRLILARDRIGKKPLHYWQGPEGLAFASEVPALLASGVEAALDLSVLGTYLCLGYVPAPMNAIRDVRRLPAGSFLTYQAGAIRTARYWSPPLPSPHQKGEESSADPVETFLPLLEESVKIRLRSDVPLGLFLSSGLDSTLVAALAARNSVEPLRTFTVAFDEAGYDESAPARETAEFIGSDHQEIRVKPDAAESLPALIRLIGEPLADSSLVAMHKLAGAVRGEVTVALSGDGGDEVFLGYDRYRAHRLAERWKQFPSLARHAARGLVAALPGARGRRNFSGRAGRFIEAASQEPLAANDRWLCRFERSALGTVLSPEAAAMIPEDPLQPLHQLYREASSAQPLDTVTRADLMLWLPEDVLRKVDAASMACGLEVRSPLLDQEIVEAASRLPATVKMPGTRGKSILRRCARKILPRNLVSRKKAGFGMPVDRWLRSGQLKDLAWETLTSSRTRQRGIIQPDLGRRLLEEHGRGEANHDEAIWTLMVFEIFMREVVDGRW